MQYVFVDEGFLLLKITTATQYFLGKELKCPGLKGNIVIHPFGLSFRWLGNRNPSILM
jgi:hypothetical protein